MKPGGGKAILCHANGKQYIGSAKSLKNRWLEHKSLLELGIHFNKHLQNAWNLYGDASFEFVIIEQLGVYERKKYLMHEDIAMSSARAAGTLLFNIAPAMGGDLGGEHTAEYVERRRSNMSSVGKNRRGKSPATVKPVTINGVTYYSGQAAINATGLPSRQVSKIRKEQQV